MHEYCTLFDRLYMPRALALYASMVEHCGMFRLSALCLDEEAYDQMSEYALPEARLLKLSDLEDADPGLASTKESRSRLEYYFTCTAAFTLHVLQSVGVGVAVTYLDSDLYFFGNPEPVFDEIGEAQIAIIPHRFTPALSKLLVFGAYNVGWLTFRNSDEGLSCLRTWRENCIDWCFNRLDSDRYADQKYLDQWPKHYKSLRVINHLGANLAPWNIGNYSLRATERKVIVEGDDLLFYHFQGLHRITRSLYDMGIGSYGPRQIRLIKDRIYRPYLRSLRKAYDHVGNGAFEELPFTGVKRNRSAPIVRRAVRSIRMAFSSLIKGFFRGSWIRA